MVVCNSSGLWQAVHSLVYSRIQPAFVTELVEVVLLPDVLWYELGGEFYVLSCRKWVVEVKVLDINARCFGPWCGDDLVKETLNCDEVCNLGGHFPLKVDAISSDCAPGLVWIRLLFPVVCHNANKGGFLV